MVGGLTLAACRAMARPRPSKKSRQHFNEKQADRSAVAPDTRAGMYCCATPEDQRAAFAAAECFDPVMALALESSNLQELRQTNKRACWVFLWELSSRPPFGSALGPRSLPIKASQYDLLSGQWRLGAAATSPNVACKWVLLFVSLATVRDASEMMARPRAGCCAAAAAKRLMATRFKSFFKMHD